MQPEPEQSTKEVALGMRVSLTQLRPVTANDEEFLRQLYASTRAQELSILDLDDNQKQAFIDMQFNAQSQQYRMSYPVAANCIVVRDDHPVGRMIVDRGDEITLVDIALLPEHRGQGIGSELIRELLDEAGGTGKPVRLHVLRNNPAARLYERLGFSINNDDGVYFEMKWTPAGKS